MQRVTPKPASNSVATSNIVLIGYRACGKGTLGRALADVLGRTYADVDELICEHFGNPSITDIWKVHGEPAWRWVEVQVTQRLMTRANQVIGLGAGTLTVPACREAVERADHVVRLYLKCDAATLHRRIEADPKSAATRPSLTDHGGGLREIEVMLQRRGPIYEAVADYAIEVGELAPPQVLDAVLRLLNDRA
jgi:shikimate kinase